MAGGTYLDLDHRTSTQHEYLEGERIALFTGAYNHIADGVSLTLNRLVQYLERHGAEVLVFAPTVDDPPVDHAGTLVPVPSIQFPGRPDYRLSLGLFGRARARFDAFAPTLVHVATPDLLGTQALRLARRRGLPVVASFHTHFASYLKYLGAYHKYYRIDRLEDLLWTFGQWFYRQCAHIYVPTPAIAAELRSHGITEGLRLWPRGVDTAFFNAEKRSTAWRRDLGIGDDEVVVTFVSRLVWEKGLHVFADVVQGLTARGIPHRSLIVGDGPAREKLVEQLPDTLFTGHLEGESLAQAYASSDLFLFPSETETFGNVTLEAMASGLPTVCADAPGSNALVDHGVTGFLVPPTSPEAFLDAVERLVVDDALRRRMGRQALGRARTFGWDEAMARIARYYVEILHPSFPPVPTLLNDVPAPAGFSLPEQVLQPSS